VTKEEVLNAIRLCAKKLHRSPTLDDLQAAGITRHHVRRNFHSLQLALASAGLLVRGLGFRLPDSTLLLDWAEVARKLRRLPTMPEYQCSGRFRTQVLIHHFESWQQVPEAFARFAHEGKAQDDWQDVLALISADAAAKNESATERSWEVPRRSSVLPGRPVYGRPLRLPEMAHEPTNEAGVVFAFGMMAQRLGFVVHRLQTEFPDCEAMREVARGQWQRVRIEFEFESRNFLLHKHQPEGCDLIVCWVHNWPECPEHLDVIELSRVARQG
jgi:hypothetical protein